mmetsp:Transcript_1501/g.4575  ORF Transcript_1501/g.4575 Transcript_1501/m.4575 type:complete len:215 (-) Transcript_1501:718-1362(-)
MPSCWRRREYDTSSSRCTRWNKLRQSLLTMEMTVRRSGLLTNTYAFILMTRGTSTMMSPLWPSASGLPSSLTELGDRVAYPVDLPRMSGSRGSTVPYCPSCCARTCWDELRERTGLIRLACEPLAAVPALDPYTRASIGNTTKKCVSKRSTFARALPLSFKTSSSASGCNLCLIARHLSVKLEGRNTSIHRCVAQSGRGEYMNDLSSWYGTTSV